MGFISGKEADLVFGSNLASASVNEIIQKSTSSKDCIFMVDLEEIYCEQSEAIQMEYSELNIIWCTCKLVRGI